MKKSLTVAILLFLTICASAQTTEVRGVLKPAMSRVVYLFQIEDGETKMVKSTKLAADGAFTIQFEPTAEGFYLIGGFTALAGQFLIYLKKGDQAQVSIDNRKMEFVGPQTEENTVLASWKMLAEELKGKTPDFDLIKGKVTAFQKDIHTKNNKFNLLMKQVVNYEMDYYALNSLKKNIGYTLVNLPPYYKTIVVKDKFKDDVLSYPNGKALVILYADYAASINKMEDGTSFLSTDRQKGIYIFDRISPKLKSYPQFEEMIAKNGQYFQHPTLKVKVDALGNKLYHATPGRKGSNFTFPDQNGKMVSLSDFKGKVVLVDVWATFCGPCKELMPALNKLEAEMHEYKDMVFIGIALDGPRAKATWLKDIKDLKLEGIQLFAGGGNNEITNDYKVKVMPRYLLFDRNGNVITTEAPLPNNPGLKKLLLAELAK